MYCAQSFKTNNCSACIMTAKECYFCLEYVFTTYLAPLRSCLLANITLLLVNGARCQEDGRHDVSVYSALLEQLILTDTWHLTWGVVCKLPISCWCFLFILFNSLLIETSHKQKTSVIVYKWWWGDNQFRSIFSRRLPFYLAR